MSSMPAYSTSTRWRSQVLSSTAERQASFFSVPESLAKRSLQQDWSRELSTATVPS